MSAPAVVKLLAWTIALALLALPVVGVLNGWFASERWPLTRLEVRAQFTHVSAEQIRTAAQPQLGAGFFAIRLDSVRAAVAELPWIERVEVRKRWPDTIELQVFERQPYAHWGKDRLTTRQGHIFAVAGSDGLSGLPHLDGPDERVADVVNFYSQSLHELARVGLTVNAVTLSSRGGWALDLASGTVIEVGRENAQAHLRRFLDVWPRLAGSRPDAPGYIDLRYENGFGIRWDAERRELEVGNGQGSNAAATRWPEERPPADAFAMPRSPLPISDTRAP